jgi:hypothetical protein
MKILVLQGLMGNGPEYPIHQGENDLPADIAKDLISRGLAEPIKPQAKAERATAKKPTQKRTKKPE